MFKINLLFIFTALSLVSCFDTDNTSSLLSPSFKRSLPTKEFINGRISKEMSYEGSQLKSVAFFDNQGNQSVVRSYEYTNNKITKIFDAENEFLYSYNDKGDLAEEKYIDKVNTNQCTTTYTYDYNGGGCPIIKIKVDCNNGYFRSYDFRHLNQYSCSSFRYAYDKNGNSISAETQTKVKYNNIINPFFHVFPGFDYYIDEIYLEGNISETISDVEINEFDYATKFTVEDAAGTKYNFQYDYIFAE